MSRQAAAQRYQGYLFEALQAATNSLMGILRANVTIRPLSRSIIQSWKTQWIANMRTPPNGGWDWEQAYNMCNDEPSRFGIAMFVDDRLCGLAVVKLNSTAVVVELIEGDPRSGCPLKGQVLLTTLQAATCYGQKAGRNELWLAEPVKEMLPVYLRLMASSTRTRRQESHTVEEGYREMNALLKRLNPLGLFAHRENAISASDDENGTHTPRPMTGLFATLTPEQRQKALEYDGPVHLGSSDFPKLASK